MFAHDCQSTRPVHPNRGFGGRQQVEAKWTALFTGVPDFRDELVAAAVVGVTQSGEWDWRGTYIDGSPFMLHGDTILVEGMAITQARLYMEPVEATRGDIDAAVQPLYRPSTPGH